MSLGLDEADVYYGEGVVLSSLSWHLEACDAFTRCLGKNPKNAVAWSNQGVVLEKLGRHEEALGAYGHAVALDPASVSSW